MLGWVIILVVSALLLTAGILCYKYAGSVTPLFLSIIPFFFLFFAVIAVLTTPTDVKIQVGEFESQKAYLESHVSDSPYEDVGLTNKKIELNQWLFTAQQKNEHWGIFSFYPDSVQNLEPIQ